MKSNPQVAAPCCGSGHPCRHLSPWKYPPQPSSLSALPALTQLTLGPPSPHETQLASGAGKGSPGNAARLPAPNPQLSRLCGTGCPLSCSQLGAETRPPSQRHPLAQLGGPQSCEGATLPAPVPLFLLWLWGSHSPVPLPCIFQVLLPALLALGSSDGDFLPMPGRRTRQHAPGQAAGGRAKGGLRPGRCGPTREVRGLRAGALGRAHRLRVRSP